MPVFPHPHRQSVTLQAPQGPGDCCGRDAERSAESLVRRQDITPAELSLRNLANQVLLQTLLSRTRVFRRGTGLRRQPPGRREGAHAVYSLHDPFAGKRAQNPPYGHGRNAPRSGELFVRRQQTRFKLSCLLPHPGSEPRAMGAGSSGTPSSLFRFWGVTGSPWFHIPAGPPSVGHSEHSHKPEYNAIPSLPPLFHYLP